VNAHDPKLYEQQQKLEAIKARLDRQENMISVVVIVAMILCVLVLILVLGGDWSPGSPLDVIL
jgi:hypothetical protein